MKMYELAEQYKNLRDEISDGDFDDDHYADTLEGLEGDIQEKGKAIASILAEMSGYSTAIDSEKKRLDRRKKVIDNKIKILKEYLFGCMKIAGIKKIPCDTFSITSVAGRDSVHIVNEDDLPSDYLIVVTEILPDKKKILSDLKSGNEISGAALVKTQGRLMIK